MIKQTAPFEDQIKTIVDIFYFVSSFLVNVKNKIITPKYLQYTTNNPFGIYSTLRYLIQVSRRIDVFPLPNGQ